MPTREDQSLRTILAGLDPKLQNLARRCYRIGKLDAGIIITEIQDPIAACRAIGQEVIDAEVEEIA